MFLKQHFYHQHIRKAIIAFGTIFNQLTVERKNSAGEVAQSIRVPLAYGPKDKFLARVAAVPGNDPASVAITLPRIGFEITGLQYNPQQKLNILTKNIAVGVGDDADKVRVQYTSTPYTLSISLFIVTKNQDDGLQIIEQILPFFNPDFCVTITDIPEMGIKRDLQIILENVSYEDNYEGEFTQRQSIVWNLTFNLGLNFYGPVDMQGYIKTAIANTYANINPDPETSEKIKYQVTYTPNDASYLDDWSYVEQFDEAYE